MHDRTFEAIRSALESRGALLAYVFGSVARGDEGERSDLDVGVLLPAELDVDALGLLAEELGRAIGFARRLDVVDLRSASPALALEVVRDGRLLLARDEVARFDFEMKTIRRYEDTRRLRAVQQDLLREAAHGSS